MKHRSVVRSISVIIGLVVLFLILFQISFIHEKVIGNPTILSEINRLLLPVSDQTLRAKDFTILRGLVMRDATASDEVHELEVLAQEKEYSHVGHGLGKLYRYIQNGMKQVCPGHALAHYYVFNRHGVKKLADANLHEAREHLPSDAPVLFKQMLVRIDSGNVSVSDDEIAELSDAECL